MDNSSTHASPADFNTMMELKAEYSIFRRWGIVAIAVTVCAITWINVLFPWQQFDLEGNSLWTLLLAILLTIAAAYSIYEALDKRPQLLINSKGVYHKQWLFKKKIYQFVPWETVWYYHFSYEGENKSLYLHIKTNTDKLMKIPVQSYNIDEVSLLQIFEHYAAQHQFSFLDT